MTRPFAGPTGRLKETIDAKREHHDAEQIAGAKQDRHGRGAEHAAAEQLA